MFRKTTKKRCEKIQSLDISDVKDSAKKIKNNLENTTEKTQKNLKKTAKISQKKAEKKLAKNKKRIAKKIKSGKLIDIKNFRKENILELILHEAKSIGIRDGGAEIIAEKTASKIYDWARKRSEITETDLNLKLANELKKYNADLAYLFEEKGKIL